LLRGDSGGGVADGQPYGPVAEVGDQVQAPSQGFHVPGDDLERGHLAVLDLGHAGHAHARRGLLVFGGVVEVQLLGERDVVPVPPLPVAGLVAARQQERRAGRIEREDDPDPGRPRDPGRSSLRW
jgi:hypothetical protein